MGGGSFKRRRSGYCPRCNSKARHRRIWLYLKLQTSLFSENKKLLHISPKYCLSRQLKNIKNLYYLGADIQDQYNISLKFDITNAPIKTDTFDSIICIHVLEHIEADMQAIQEIFRILKPGGWVVLSVPIRLKQKTYEDPLITTPKGRVLAYGESGHYRFYGYDLSDKFEQCGFRVNIDLAENVDQRIINDYGLLKDENIFYLEK